MAEEDAVVLPLERYAGVPLDAGAREACRLAAWIGETSGDETLLGFTALLIGLTLVEEPSCAWLASHLRGPGVNAARLYERRKFSAEAFQDILSRSAGKAWPSSNRAPASVSARRMLSAAADLASATAGGGSATIRPRHLIAAYAYRLPPDHDRDFVDWSIDPVALREGFFAHIAARFADEAEAWARALGITYTPPSIAPVLLQRYDGQVLAVLRAAFRLTEERASAAGEARELTLGRLICVLAESGFAPEPFTVAEVWKRGVLTTERFAEIQRRELAGVSRAAAGDAPFDEGENLPALDAGVAAVLESAAGLARDWPGGVEPPIGLAQVSAAIAASEQAAAWFAQLGLTTAGVQRELRQALAPPLPGSPPAAQLERWLFGEHIPEGPALRSDHVGRVTPDDDRLDVTRYARAFAATIAANAVKPPLSIGVFGDWGSGKSFFMRLIESQVTELAGSGRTYSNDERVFCKDVVPVWFNAWHYADANLWASLVFTLFQELDRYVGGAEAERASLEKLMRTFEVAGVMKSEAEAVEGLARARVDAAKRSFEDAEEAARRRAQNVASTVSERAKTLFAQAFVSGEVKKRLSAAADALGLEPLGTVAAEGELAYAEIRAALADARVVQARGRSAFDWLLSAPLTWREGGWLLGGVAMVGGLGWAAIELLGVESAVGQLSTVLVQVTGLAVAGAGWTRRTLGRVHSALDGLDALRAELDAKVERAVQTDATVQAATRELEAARLAVEAARAGVADAERERQRAAQALKEGLRSVRLAQFIQQRLGAQEYEKQLGLISVIRRDLTLLGAFLNPPGAQASVEEREAVQKLQEAGIAITSRPVDRIVLFIDDLDRCPPERVVEVLEAVHLLLAMPLFVVVVGVDMRWVTHALHQRFPRQLGELDERVGNRASALDYLEKIFQLAFWLPPMGRDEAEALMNSLIELPVTGLGQRGDKSGSAATAVPGDLERKADADHGSVPTPEVSIEAAEVDGRRKPVIGQVAITLDGVTAYGIGTVTELKRALTATDAERTYMLALAEGIGRSPRRALRFVNSYRVFKASLRQRERDAFERGSDFRGVLTLLAITTGAPRAFEKLFARLAGSVLIVEGKGEGPELERFVESLGAGDDERAHLLAALRTYAAAHEGCSAEELLQELGRIARDYDVTRFTFRTGAR